MKFPDCLYRRFFRIRFSVFALLLSAFAGSLHADTIVLKDGTQITNVRTWVTKGQIHMIDHTGQTRSFQETEVVSIKPENVNWAQEKTPTSVFDRPAMLAAAGILPGWSGLYRSEHYIGGLMFSGFDLLFLFKTFVWSRPPVSQFQEFLPVLIPLTLGGPPGQPAANPALLVYAFSLRAQVKNPEGQGYISREEWQLTRSRYQIGLLTLMAADAILSVIYGIKTDSAADRTTGDVRWSAGIMPEGRGGNVYQLQFSIYY